MLCLHCSPPTSDPRAPEQREPHSLLTDIKWTPGVSSDSPETDGRPPGSPPKATRKPPKAALHPRDPRTGTPAQLAQVSHDCPGAHATTERRTLAEEPDERSSPLPAEQRTGNRGTARHTTATTTPPETPTTTLRYLTRHGEGPPALSRDPRPGGQTERAPRGTPGPRRLDTAAQQWTAYVWMRQHLREIRSAPKTVLAHAAPARGIVHVSRRVLPNGRF